jgi:type 1 fimbriae regulatory protein FimB/type 1 fimbriae regulatory protein FimE
LVPRDFFTVFGKVAVPRPKPKAPRTPPRRRKNAEARGREHLTDAEVEALEAAAGKFGRRGFRDALMVHTAYRHGLRVSELVTLRRDQLDLAVGQVHVRRAKHGTPSTHPLGAAEVRRIRKLLKAAPEGPYLFTSERGGPLTVSAFRKVVARAGAAAGLPYPAHPHKALPGRRDDPPARPGEREAEDEGAHGCPGRLLPVRSRT